LVVIAIIAIIAAILFPVFARVRENARRASCQSNMKQLGLGIIQYTQDYDEHYPWGRTRSYLGGNYIKATRDGVGWASSIYPYVKSAQVYKCPSDSSKPRTEDSEKVVSYAFNSLLVHPTNGCDRAVAALNSPAKTVMLCEVANSSGNVDLAPSGLATAYGVPQGAYELAAVSPGTDGLYVYGLDYQPSNCGWLATGFMGGRGGTAAPNPNVVNTDPTIQSYRFQYNYGRHLEGSNFLMADGHVKWLKGDAVSSGTSKAATSIAAQTGDSGSGAAEGTEYSGAHAVTFSPT
jgi:prepilin-type processing-associated H-X9-DG protein